MCTSIVTTTDRGEDLFGRTLDFPQRTPWSLTYLPRQFAWWDVLAPHHRPLEHAILGGMRPAGGHWLIADGVNDAGLLAAELYFPIAADYFSEEQPGKLNLSPESFIYWLLAEHSTVAEIKADLGHVAVVARKWFDDDKVFPFHWLLSDDTGTYVIEPLAKQLVMMKNPAEVLTNTPALPKQYRRLNAHLGLTGADFTSETKAALATFSGPRPKTNNAVDRFMKAALARWQNQVKTPTAVAAFLKTVCIPTVGHKYNFTHYYGVINRHRSEYWFHDVLTGREVHQSLPALVKKYHTVQNWH